MTSDVNAQSVCTVAFVRDAVGSIPLWRSDDDRIWKSCRLFVMSVNSSFFPEHEGVNSDTQMSGETLESAKLRRRPSNRSASSCGELFTCTGTVPVAVFCFCCPPLV